MSSQLPRLGSWGIGGISQMTSAAQALLGRATRSNGGTKRRRSGKKKAASANGASKRRRKSKKKGKLKKGSAAAKAYMAKIRKMRK